MRARTITTPLPRTRTIVVAEISALVLVAALTTVGVRSTWPVIAGVVMVVAALATVRVHDRNLAGWVTWWLRGRHQPDQAAALPDGVDVHRGDHSCGVLRDSATATAVVEICGTEYTPTVLSGSGHAMTSNTIPLEVVAEQMIQPGPLVLAGIDVVDTGFRVRRAQGYPPLYSSVLTEHPARGNASTYALVRLDISASAQGLLLRSSVEDATAAVADRFVCALQESGCRARALSMADIGLLVDDLAGPLLSGASTAQHRYLNNDDSYWASYVYSAEDITAANLNDVWSWRVDAAVSTVTFRRGDDGRVRLSAMVRTQTPQRPALAPTVYLNTPVGDQVRAALACVPGGPRMPDLPSVELDAVEGLAMPIGSAGQLIGYVSTGGRRQLVLLPLTDPQRDTRVLVRTGIMYARQLLLRAAAIGHPVSVYTDTPQKWAGLHEQEPLIEIHRSPTATPVLAPHIVVKDRQDGASPVTAATIVSMSTDTSYPKGLAPDISFTQIDDHTVAVHTAKGQTKVTIATFPDEQSYLFPSRR